MFAQDEEAGLRRCIPAILASGVDEVLVQYGGTDGSRAYLESIDDPRLRLEYEEARLGKWRAFNHAVERVRGEVVFLASADVAFGPAVLDRLWSSFGPEVGVVFPRVVPTNRSTVVSRMGRLLWDVHDRQIVEFARRGYPFHGGELLAVRRSLLEPLDGVINDDAFLCLRAAEQGYRVVYDRASVVYNTVPETVADFLRQRVRVNYGHRQLSGLGLPPSTLDRLFFQRPALCLDVLGRVVADRPSDGAYLPLLAGLELVALARGARDFRRGVDHGRWSLVRSGKEGSFPVPPNESATAALRR